MNENILFYQLPGIFPEKFCQTRWVEDVKIANRALVVWPSIKKYVRATEALPKSKRPSCASYCVLLNATKDPLIPAKFQAFKAAAAELIYFLEAFQADKPMLPFLHQYLHEIYRKTLEKVVPPKSLDNLSFGQMMELDLSDDRVVRSAKYVELNFATKEALRNAEVDDQKMLLFKMDVKHLHIGMLDKIKERSSLKYDLTNAVDCLNPHTIAKRSPATLKGKMETLLMQMTTAKLLSVDQCDIIEREFTDFVEVVKSRSREEFASFDIKTDRLDTFMNEFCSAQKYGELWKLFKIVFILASGNADVERGFSVNKDLLKDNMKEATIKNHSLVYNSVQVGFNLNTLLLTSIK